MRNSKNLTNSGRYADEQVCSNFQTKKLIGKSGTNFIENTYSLHRGFKPKDNKNYCNLGF